MPRLEKQTDRKMKSSLSAYTITITFGVLKRAVMTDFGLVSNQFQMLSPQRCLRLCGTYYVLYKL